MLSESSYLTAIYAYIGAAGVILLYLGWILRRTWRPAWVALAILVSGALLLTPAYPEPGASTFAPALVVAVFEGLLHGPDAAQHAVKPLAITTGLALLIALLLRITLFRAKQAS